MKEHPILFSAPMVIALLKGRKFVTRRLDTRWLKVKAGDRLWVRETWADVHPLQVADGRYSQPGQAGIPGPPLLKYRAIYRADGEHPRIHFQSGAPTYPYREVCRPGCTRDHVHPAERWHGWAPSIHMPRWASRIVLECEEDARLERVQCITEGDALLEGVEPFSMTETDLANLAVSDEAPDVKQFWKRMGPGRTTARMEFQMLWSTLHTKPGQRWDDNPTVVRIGRFRKITA